MLNYFRMISQLALLLTCGQLLLDPASAAVIRVKPVQESLIPVMNKQPDNHLRHRYWTDAIEGLEAALLLAKSGDELWIQEGRYTPPINLTNGRSMGFLIPSKSLRLIGGFKGYERSAEEREGTTRKTVIDGNIGDPRIKADNAYRLLAITGGNGIQSELESISFQNTYNDSPLLKGGAVLINGQIVTFRDCIFSKNFTIHSGAAIYKYLFGGTKVLHSEFENNEALLFGGAISSIGGFIYNSRFSENQSGAAGGAIDLISAAGFPLIVNSSFWQNRSMYGGGVLVANPSPEISRGFLLVNNTFAENMADLEGGAVYIEPIGVHKSGNILNSLFWNNIVESPGSSDPQVSGPVWNVSYNDFFPAYESEDSGETYLRIPLFTGNRVIQDNPFVHLPSGDLRLRPRAASIDSAWELIYQRDVFNLTIHSSYLLDYLDMDRDQTIIESPPHDALGLPRWQGASLDRGAYEAQKPID